MLIKKVSAIILILPLVFLTAWSKSDVNRFYGKDRYETSAIVSSKSFKNNDTVFISSGENPYDALSGGALVIQEKASLLLTQKNTLPDSVEKEVERLKVKKVIIFGGEESVSKMVENKLSKYAKVQRLCGKNRYDTAKIIYEFKNKLNPKSTTKAIVSGKNYADALVSAPYLKSEGSLLFYDGNIEKDVSLVFGGKNSVDKYDGIKRFFGSDRYETSIEVAKALNSKSLIFASGENFADSLSAITLSSANNIPIVLIKNNEIPLSVKTYLEKSKIEKAYIVGGKNTISDSNFNNISKLIRNSTSEPELSKVKPNTGKTDKKRNLNEKVIFADEKIKKEVLTALSTTSNLIDSSKIISKDDIKTYNPTIGDMENLKELDISSLFDKDYNPYFPESIKGLETAVNLENLRLRGIKAKDIYLIKDMKKLKKLDLSRNELENAEFIKDMKSLETLKLSTNKISDINFLSELKSLKYLDMNENNISNIRPIKNLKQLEFLYLNWNKINDISPIEKLENLVEIEFSSNEIKSIEKIGKKPKLEKLHLTGNYVGPFDTPDQSGNCINDISPLANMTNLKVLFLQDVRNIENIKPLAKLKKLEQLTLRNNKIVDVSPLSELTNLKWLHIYKNKVSDISSLSKLTNLYEFNFAVNQIENIDVVRNMKKLTTLMGYSNKISDISPIKELDALENYVESDSESSGMINLSRNKIYDFSAIKNIFSKENHGRYSMIIQNPSMTLKALNKKEDGNIIKITVKNPLINPTGEIFSDIVTEKINIDEDELNEFKDFYIQVNEAIDKILEKNTEILTEDDKIIISLPKDKYINGKFKIEIPYMKIYFNEDFERDPFGGVLTLDIIE